MGPPVPGKPDLFFARRFSVWGWGTWKRAWRFFEPNGEMLLNKIKKRKEEWVFNHYGTSPDIKMLKNIGEWDCRWYASIFVNEKLCLHSGINLVQHIGKFGIHFDGTNGLPVDVISTQKPVVKKIPVDYSDSVSKNIFCKYNKMVFGGFCGRIKLKLMEILRVCLPFGIILFIRKYRKVGRN